MNALENCRYLIYESLGENKKSYPKMLLKKAKMKLKDLWVKVNFDNKIPMTKIHELSKVKNIFIYTSKY